MILLHHPEVELSRNLLAALPDDATSIDCKQGLPCGYNGPQPSAFPSVVVGVPAYSMDTLLSGEDGAFLGMARTIVPAHQEALRLPVSWAAVQSFVDWVEARALANPAG